MLRSLLFVLLFAASTSFAGSVAAPGDIGLRHDIQVLADYGVITGPVTSWPISWDALVADLQVAVDSNTIYPNAVERTLQRLILRANREVRRGDAQFSGRVSAAAEPMRIRGFSNTPREKGEASAGVSWLGKHLSLDLNATAVVDPEDGEEAE